VAAPAAPGAGYARVMPATIRRYRADDETRLYEISLRTGDAGRDATGQYLDPRLIGHVYVGPYLALAPEHVLVLDSGGTAVGFALGVPDTAAFETRCERSWWPRLRRHYRDPVEVPAGDRSPDEEMAHLIHHPETTPAAITTRFPAHLHISLLPAAQGRGHGRRLIARLLGGLTAAGATGVHLGVDLGNDRAIGFYHRLGFVEIDTEPGGILMGMPLPAPHLTAHLSSI
jgi:GNAT superfamily N-acetyltransferase